MANKKFSVYRTEFHGGAKISEHNSLKEAIKSMKKETLSDCTCGCAYIKFNTKESIKEMIAYEKEKYGDSYLCPKCGKYVCDGYCDK